MTGNSMKLRIYPLPVKSEMTIEFSGKMQSIEIFDFQGRMIKKSYPASGIFNLDMSVFSPGIYLIRIITNDRNFVRKFIKE